MAAGLMYHPNHMIHMVHLVSTLTAVNAALKELRNSYLQRQRQPQPQRSSCCK